MIPGTERSARFAAFEARSAAPFLLRFAVMSDVKKIMTSNPTCCTPESSIEQVAQMMVECDCGEIPVVQSMSDKRPIGVVTDRDIVVRSVAMGKNPLDLKASDIMSTPCVTVSAGDSVKDCMDVMEKHQIRRVPVVDNSGALCGIVAQADLAREAPKKAGEVVKSVSQPANGKSATI